MNIMNFALKMLNRNYKASFVYGMILLFSIASIFIFIEIGTNTNIAIDSSFSVFSVTLANIMPTFVCFFCWIVIIYATNYYFSYKGKEFSLLYLSGASTFAKIRYIAYQILIILLLVAPFGIVIGYGIIMFLYQTVFASLYPVISIDTFTSVFVSLGATVAVTIFFTMGYLFRTSVLDLQKERKTKWLRHHKHSRVKSWMAIIGYSYSIYASSISVSTYESNITTNVTRNILLAFVCVLSIYIMLNHTVPRMLEYLKKKNLFCNSSTFISTSYYLSTTKNTMVIMIFLLAIPTIFSPSLATQVNGGIEYNITLICYLFLIVLSCIALICKYLNHTIQRHSEYKTLLNIGYSSKQIKNILKQEVALLYSSIIILPLPLVMIISYSYITYYEQSIMTFIIIITLYIIPLLVSAIATHYLQYKNLAKRGAL